MGISDEFISPIGDLKSLDQMIGATTATPPWWRKIEPWP
jgi:hypothetical protein